MHQQIATNLLLLLVSSLATHDSKLAAYQRGGINLGPAIQHYDPEPDVLVVDAEVTREPERRYADRFYLAAEVVSSSDRTFVESKRGVYKLHEASRCVLIVQQDRVEVRIDVRNETGWSEKVLTKLDDVIEIRDFGLRCKVSDLYRGTPLALDQQR